MNPDEQKLELELARELRSLPDLPAPATLAPRVLAAIARQANPRWYRRPWPAWPRLLQAGSMALLLALFGALCFGGWELQQAAGAASGVQQLGMWFSGVAALWRSLNVVAGALASVVAHLDSSILLAGFAAAALGYAVCVGLVAAYVRLGLVRNEIYERTEN